MNRVKDIAIIVLLLAVEYLLATRNGTLTVSDDSQTAAVSIVVLPYVNVGRDPDDEYLSNSVWNETINSLANHPELRIVSRTSSSRFKGVNEDMFLKVL
jgi:TolB-like protein